MTGRRLSGVGVGTAVLACLLPLAACGTATIEDAVPVAASEASAPQPAPPFSTPGDYPNLNVIPKPAASQITADEKAADTTLLRSIRERQQAQGRAGKTGSAAAELRRIGRSHASDALRQIEGE